jgi:nucleotide-binding universal stress UspA family protein
MENEEATVRILSCLDGTNAEQIGKALKELSALQALAVGMLHVTDTRPRKDLDLIRERFWRRSVHPPHLPLPPEHPPQPPAQPPQHPPINPPREQEIAEAERASAADILNEGRRYFAGAETLEREGRPELEIVNLAAEWRADLVLVCSRAVYPGREEVGPKSVGHVARFVLDHAPCPVLLLRPLAREQFPIDK